MSDERISQMPTSTHCPVCASGFTAKPGASCPACGRTLVPPIPPPVRDLRWRSSDEAFSRLEAGVVAGASLLGIVAIALFTPIRYVGFAGLFLPLVIIIVPALIRTLRLAMMLADRDAKPGFWPLLGSLAASLGVAALAGTASFITFGIVCFGVSSFDNPKSIMGTDKGAYVGFAAGFVVFLLVFLRLWPRPWSGPPSPPDPEN